MSESGTAQSLPTGSLSVLDQLKNYTIVVADTGNFHSIKQYEPRDATTNPSLILKSASDPQYSDLVDEVVFNANKKGVTDGEAVMGSLLVKFGASILEIVPGRVSTEVDARLSFDIKSSLEKARSLIARYESLGYERERVLIKLASTWEGVEVSRVLEKEGIHCNMTLLFSMAQAVACAEANSKLISPFVGRILDWFREKTGKEYEGAKDPGVLSVTEIYNYYKKFDYPTEVMAASFRNTNEIKELVGCDLMTIGPKFLDEMQNDYAEIPEKLNAETSRKNDVTRMDMNESTFRFLMNQDEMAHFKLAEGIRKFSNDVESLGSLLNEKLSKIS